ncbi:MAG: I78 family peptidase inhibitor [Porphyrobacter sp.]|jgi:hypothetical protein|nr:I78 family peptidase inhibitor [Porphyrobacter sp.]
MPDASQMTPNLLAAAVAATLLAACAGSNDEVASAPAPAETARLCDAARVQSYAGQTVTAAMGAAILKESGARTLRWGPPRSAWTMDYRQDRVNVRYDDAMRIIDVTCG